MSKFVVCSVETTGLNPKANAIYKLSLVFYEGSQDNLQEIGVSVNYIQLNHLDIWDLDTYRDHHKDYLDNQKYDKESVVSSVTAFLKEGLVEGEKYTLIGWEAPFQQSFLSAFLPDYYTFFYSVPICVLQLVSLALGDNRRLLPNFKYQTVLTLFGLCHTVSKPYNVLFFFKESLKLLKGK